MKQVGIIDYKAGNIRSAVNSIREVILKNDMKYKIKISSDWREIERSDLLIFPGQGAAKQAMNALKRLELDKAIKESIDNGKPFFGICIGMQVLFDYSEEQDTNCLGIISGKVVKFSNKITLPIPNIGWRMVNGRDNDDINLNDYFYFIHSYYPVPKDRDLVARTTNYGIEFASVIKTNNILATQFHPEKSGQAGLNLIYEFLKQYE